jgi:predicted nucleic acid-binding Zn ribbon protein
MTAEEPPAGEPPAEDGLDLARAITRSLAGAAGAGGRGRTGERSRGRTGGDRRRRTGGLSGPRPGDRDPQPLDATLGRLVSDRGWELDLRVQAMFGRWPDLVGAEVAAHATPESFADGRLVVRTDSTAWATQLRLLAPAVVRRLNEDLGHGTVAVIEVLGPHLPTWKKGKRSMRDGRGPRDTYG